MKVQKIINWLQDLDPDSDIACLWWTKPSFFEDDWDGEEVSNQMWADICQEFDDWDNAGTDINDWIADAIIEHKQKRSETK
jgi:hypothetical protein